MTLIPANDGFFIGELKPHGSLARLAAVSWREAGGCGGQFAFGPVTRQYCHALQAGCPDQEQL
jgi:hypothetical protein